MDHQNGPRRSRNRWLHLLLVLLVLALVPPAVADAQDVISEVMVIYGAKPGIQPLAGYTKILVDLNQGASGNYVFACFKRGVGAPVTDLAVTLGDAQPPAGPAWTRVDVDLNRGSGGDLIWLWYTRDPSCSRVRDLVVLRDRDATPAGYIKIPVNLNENVGGAMLYFAYQMD
jgi:hypothetical protein